MMQCPRLMALALGVLTALSSDSAAQISNPTINYQGRLDDEGAAANGTYEMIFQIFAAPTGGSFQANAGTGSNPVIVEVENGIFSADLNFQPSAAIAFDGTDRWVQILIRRPGMPGFTALSPRQRLTTVPHSYRTSDIPNEWKAFSNTPGGLVYSGNGGVGIGTEAPTHRLDVSAADRFVSVLQSSSTIGTWFNLRNTSAGGAFWRLISTGSGNGEGAGKLLIGHGSQAGVHSSVMTMQTDGRVGINTTSPQRALDVNGWARVHVFEVTGGSDIAEPFRVNAETKVIPGMVVCIDPENIGEMRLSTTPYDRTVAGVVSGAGGVNTGMTLRQEGSIADGDTPIALTGRVYCYVDADAGGPIVPGDMLTTSPTVGHAMRVQDHARATGAVIGKAMSSLESGRGLVLVLVNLH